MSGAHNIKDWARIRTTSIEIAEAIFEIAKGEEELAQKIWEEGSDEVLLLAFSRTDKDTLFWEAETVERKNV